MSFLRHKQIYRPMLPKRKRSSLIAAPPSSSDESATGYSSASYTPAELASASPVDVMVNSVVGNRQPPLGKGWGIFIRRNEEISAGVDNASAMGFRSSSVRALARSAKCLTPQLDRENPGELPYQTTDSRFATEPTYHLESRPSTTVL